ncbi:hypothetical protein ACLOJK_007150 [Asimina triloba]
MASSVPVSPLSQERPSSPHPAFFFALASLRLPELFVIRLVCKSLRDAVDADPLIWRSITVEPPLSSKLTDSILLDITAKAHGSLRSLALIDCRHISDEGLRQVAESNPGITKVFLQAYLISVLFVHGHPLDIGLWTEAVKELKDT